MTVPAEGRLADYEAWQPGSWAATFGDERDTKLRENWPSGVRVAVLLTFDTQGDIDAAVPGYQGGAGLWTPEHINYKDVTQRQYGVRRGVPRILRLLDRYDIKATFPMCGATAEWYPGAVETILAAGHEVAAHGHRHVVLYELSDEEERIEIERATAAIEKVSGQRPRGWRSPIYTATWRTLDILRDLGYLYHSDFHNHDLPYFLDRDGKSILEIPAGLDDWGLYLMGGPNGTPYGTPANVTDILVSHFEYLYEESAEEPRIFQFCMHPKISGFPYRTYAIEQAIRHMRSRSGVWFCTMEQLARLC